MEIREFVGVVRPLLEKGRRKYRDICVQFTTCLATLLVQVPRPTIANYARERSTLTSGNHSKIFLRYSQLIGVENSEEIFLNDFHWSAQIFPWHNLLLLVEGTVVHFPAPKTHYARDIVFEKDAPVFATAKEHFSFVQGSAVDQVETEMMRVRWPSFQFFSQIPQDEQVDILPCPRCFAEFILH